MSIRVRAKRPGFYQGARRRAGDTFTVPSEQELGTWMERVGDGTPATDPPAQLTAEPAKGKATKGKSVI